MRGELVLLGCDVALEGFRAELSRLEGELEKTGRGRCLAQETDDHTLGALDDV
jgi:hypothetical protein